MFKSVEELFSNPHETFLSSSEILLKFAENILQHPTEAKYRKIRVANERVERHLLVVTGGMQCLFDMGFVEDGEFLTLPMNASLAGVRAMKRELVERRQGLPSPTGLNQSIARQAVAATASSSFQQQQTVAAVAPSSSVAAPRAASESPATHPVHSQASLSALRERERRFALRVHSDFERVLIYQDVSLQAKAQAIIPRADLLCKAQARTSGGEGELRDLYLLELLAWFKSFFRWTDCLPCSSCQQPTSNTGMLTPTDEELRYGAARVENHHCAVCNLTTRFPRYNHPGRLLETRSGRCGEWANCFTLCCVAEGFEARHVVDWTDHVWTEVYSEAQRRWLHCDPCENVCDNPLLYEVGWGKKLTYVMAYSRHDVQDVTWRYVSHHADTLGRRDECRESWLVGLLLRLRAQRQRSLDAELKRRLLERCVGELVEFILEPSGAPEGGGRGGRTTGSLEWRLARGELGVAAAGGAESAFTPGGDQSNRGGTSMGVHRDQVLLCE